MLHERVQNLDEQCQATIGLAAVDWIGAGFLGNKNALLGRSKKGAGLKKNILL